MEELTLLEYTYIIVGMLLRVLGGAHTTRGHLYCSWEGFEECLEVLTLLEATCCWEGFEKCLVELTLLEATCSWEGIEECLVKLTLLEDTYIVVGNTFESVWKSSHY